MLLPAHIGHYLIWLLVVCVCGPEQDVFLLQPVVSSMQSLALVLQI